MNRQITMLTMSMLVVTLLVIIIHQQETFACGCKASNNSRSAHHGLPPPMIVAPRPPGFPFKWVNRDVVKSFIYKKLEVKNVEPITETDLSSFPVKTKEATKFSIPSSGDDEWGYILSFEEKGNLEKTKKHYLDLNEKGDLYNWSFVKDNILLVLTGTIPAEKARQYESVLYDLK